MIVGVLKTLSDVSAVLKAVEIFGLRLETERR